jgi:hypothetical protein
LSYLLRNQEMENFEFEAESLFSDNYYSDDDPTPVAEPDEDELVSTVCSAYLFQ